MTSNDGTANTTSTWEDIAGDPEMVKTAINTVSDQLVEFRTRIKAADDKVNYLISGTGILFGLLVGNLPKSHTVWLVSVLALFLAAFFCFFWVVIPRLLGLKLKMTKDELASGILALVLDPKQKFLQGCDELSQLRLILWRKYAWIGMGVAFLFLSLIDTVLMLMVT